MKKASPKFIVAMTCLVFLVFGLFNGSIGPIVKDLSNQTNSTLGAIGGVLTFLFMGALISMFVAGPLTDKVGKKIVMVISLIFLSTGIIGLCSTHSLPLMFFFFFFTGLGQGGMEVSGNLVVADAFPENNTGIMNLLHFFYGFGAFSGPAIISLAISNDISGKVVLWVAAGLFAILAVLFVILYTNKPKSTSPHLAENKTLSTSVYRSPLLWLTGGMLLTYVGVEFGLGSWSTTFMEMSAQLPIQQGALVTSAYWGFITLGRLAGLVLSRKYNSLQLLGLASIGALIGGVALVIFTGTTTAAIGIIMFIGFCFGTVYPSTIAFTSDTFIHDQGKAVGLVSTFGSIGGLTLPWLAGLILVQQTPLV
ncbi:MFS transporter, partial [bacterium]|nr:MFS transporter [bacterium]